MPFNDCAGEATGFQLSCSLAGPVKLLEVFSICGLVLGVIRLALGDASLSAPLEEHLNGKALQFVLNKLALSGSKTATLQALHDGFNNRSKPRYLFTVIQKSPFRVKVKCLDYALAQCFPQFDNVIYLHISPRLCPAISAYHSPNG